MDAGGVLDVLYGAADAVARALEQLQDWGPAGTRAGQYRSDLVADEAAIAILDGAGMGVLSEESGVQRDDRELLVVLDPLDGSTNASRRIPWYATSLCALDSDGPWVAVVVNQANHTRFDAVRGGGARRNGIPISPSSADRLSDSIIGLSGYPDQHMGWRQYRALGAAALDLCAVAEGVLDGFVDCSPDSLGPWDYMGGLLICEEAGAQVVDAWDRDLVVRSHEDRRTPLAGAGPELLAQLLTAHGQVFGPAGDENGGSVRP